MFQEIVMNENLNVIFLKVVFTSQSINFLLIIILLGTQWVPWLFAIGELQKLLASEISHNSPAIQGNCIKYHSLLLLSRIHYMYKHIYELYMYTMYTFSCKILEILSR